MSTTHENQEFAHYDDPQDRLVDLALQELVGGTAPPDLSERILNTTQVGMSPVVERASATSRRRRYTLAILSIAAALLVGAATLLWSTTQDRKTATDLAQAERLGSDGHASPRVTQADKSIELLNEHAGQPLVGEAAKGRREAGVVTVQESAPVIPLPELAAQSPGSLSSASPQAPQTRGEPMAQGGPEGPGAAGNLVPALASRPVEKSVLSKYSINLKDKSLRSSSDDKEIPVSQAGKHIEAYELSSPARPQSRLQEPQPAIVADQSSFGVALPAQTTPPISLELQSALAANESEVAGKPEQFYGDRYALNTLQQQPAVPGFQRATDDVGAFRNSGDRYIPIVENVFIKTQGADAVSTFGIDVDTASYSNVRQFLLEMHQLPPANAVRIEELVNYFHYDYTAPSVDDAVPFAAHVEVASCPWNKEHRLARIAVKGREMDRTKRPQSNLVFLIDVSGSMNEPAKLPLVKYGLEQLTRELGENDHIAIVVYAGTEGLVLPSTSGSKQDVIVAAFRKLEAGGSTAGGAGIQLAYQIAEDNFIKGGTNRVILCTDGDFNVGVTNTDELQKLVEKKAKETGVFISTLGFGRGNLNDAMMVAISDHGNGNYHYIDNRTEARRVLVEQMTGTLVTIAKDVKIQVEFNPAQVAAYRLIGYEKRMLRTEDFNDDKKDAGEIGAGHTVTALYEIVPAGKKIESTPAVDDLKYQKAATSAVPETAKYSAVAESDPPSPTSHELLTLKMRYKVPDGDTSKKLEWPVTDGGKDFGSASDDFRFASAVAGFGLLLRDSQYKGNLTYATDLDLAEGGLGRDDHGYRSEFLDMVRETKRLKGE